MKIVCDACSAKYSIADEKVRGKVFKIRCKKCSNIIVVRGQSSEQPAGTYDQKETKVFDYSGYENPGAAAAAAEAGDDAVWHLVIDQEQVGPMSADEVHQRFQRGEIDADSYVWREGFSDWERLADVDAFAGLAAGNGSAAEGGLFGGGQADDGRTVQSDPGDLFAARGGDEPDAGNDLFGGGMAAASGSEEEEGGLFGSSAGGGGGAMAAAAAAPAPAAAGNLTGQRNENSVLFSLNNLAALASDSPRSSAPASSSSSSSLASGSSSGMAQNEGSGLIDIRSMAQVYLGDNKQAPSKSVGSVDDLPVFSQTSFEAASPVLLPTAQPAVNNRLLIALVGLIGVLVIAAVILVIVVLKGGGEDDKPKVAAADPAAAQAGAADPAAPTPADPAAAAGTAGAADQPAGGEGDEGEGKDEKDEPAPAAKQDDDKEKRSSKSDRRDSRSDKRESSRRSSKPDPKPEPERKPAPNPTATSGCDEVTCLVEPDKPCCRKGGSSSRKSSGSSSSSSNSNLPETPSRSDVSSGIAKVKGKVKACNGSGTITARIKISPSGSVSSVNATGGSPSANTCVERAVKKARFPKTQRGVTVNYPFVF